MKITSRSFLGENSYITYPHTNAFAWDGEALVYAQKQDNIVHLQSLELSSGKKTTLQQIEGTPLGWYDVALRAPRIAAVFNNRAWLLDLQNPQDWSCVYTPEPGVRLDGLCSLSADGTRLVCSERRDEQYVGLEIDLKQDSVRELFSKNWFANHFHYCPHDESWVAFSHEGPAESMPDRCWVWHAEKAPEGRVAFDQASAEPGLLLCVGHERWAFHDTSAYVVAYAVSPVGKRGLYEIFADGRPARLLWENDVLWHCNMDLSGRFVAVDTTGPLSKEKLSDQEYQFYRDRHVETDLKRGSNTSDVGIIDLQTGEILPVATVRRSQHPYHPHPAISPDGRWIIWNDCATENQGAWVASLSLVSGSGSESRMSPG